jgi:hypothetical protein
MIMRSFNDDGFDLLLDDLSPLPLGADTATTGSIPNWRFVRFGSVAQRHMDQPHVGIGAPHIRRTPAPNVCEPEFNETIYFG